LIDQLGRIVQALQIVPKGSQRFVEPIAVYWRLPMIDIGEMRAIEAARV
jgi:hypothetical protein